MKSLLFNQRLQHPDYHRISLAEERALYDMVRADIHQIQSMVELFLARIYHHCYFHLGDDLAAEKATRQIFEELPYAFKSYRWQDTQPLSKWLYERMRKHLTKKVPIQPALTTESTHAEAFTRLSEDEKLLVLKDTLSRLPFDQREVLILTYYDGLAPEQIGALLGSSANDAEVLVGQALELMHTRLESSARQVTASHPAFIE